LFGNITFRITAFRPGVESDVERILPLLQRDAASLLSAEVYTAKLATREYRPEWTWIAEDGENILAVAVWWAGPNQNEPNSLDGFCVGSSVTAEDRTALAAELLTTAQQHFATELGLAHPPEYHVFVPGDWREDADVVAALTWRQEAAQRAGLSSLLERLRYEWTPEAGIPAPSGRLTFRAEPDDEVFVDLFTRVLEGSLDITSTAEAAEMGAEAQARDDVEFYRDVMLGERSWWRVAENADGEVVGFGFPSRNPGFPVVGYLGVLPEHRGHGYVDDILGEITRLLGDEIGVEVIRADTDLQNEPMAASFSRAGYRNFARRLVFSAPAASPAE
jgi:RimJ/RimL family protein N-acetyltransferase